MIVGVSGRKRSGKDTVAMYLGLKYGCNRIAFADHLKYIAMLTWDLSFEQCYGPDEVREVVDPRWGLSPRQILQRIGTEVARNIHEDTWVRKTFSTIERGTRGEDILYPDMDAKRFVEGPASGRKDRWAIPDSRFPNEAQAIWQRGGIVVKVERPSLGVSTDLHASERGVDDITPDVLLVNDGTLADLFRQVDAFVADRLGWEPA